MNNNNKILDADQQVAMQKISVHAAVGRIIGKKKKIPN